MTPDLSPSGYNKNQIDLPEKGSPPPPQLKQKPKTRTYSLYFTPRYNITPGNSVHVAVTTTNAAQALSPVGDHAMGHTTQAKLEAGFKATYLAFRSQLFLYASSLTLAPSLQLFINNN